MRRVQHDRPIITSLFDGQDFYKFPMGQFAWMRYPDVDVIYALRCRTKGVHLGELLDLGRLREELDHVRTLMFTNSELHYLRGTNEYGNRMFCEPYLEFLRGMRLPEYRLEKVGPDIILEFRGPWPMVKLWETIALAVVNELYNIMLMKHLSRFEIECLYAAGRLKLAEKIKTLLQHPDIFISDFGSRRRFSGEWQQYVNEVLCEELKKQFLGSSNTGLAMHCGTTPMGTNAHSLQMIIAALRAGQKDWLRESQHEVLEGWWQQYGHGLSIFLPDTYGSEFFFDNLTQDELRNWKGVRHDSGEPFAFGDRLIARYERHGIDPKTKLLIFSDGLDIGMILKLHAYFSGRIKLSYGWGTTLTNDLWPNEWRDGLWYGPLSLVVKPKSANGKGTVKFSDNIGKFTGEPSDIEYYKIGAGYTNIDYVECKV